MAFGGLVATALHGLERWTHPISLVIPPLTVAAALGQFAYLFGRPGRTRQVIGLSLGWVSLIMLFPEYFFTLEAALSPDKQLIETLPPISSGLFLLTTGMIVFLRPRQLVRLSFLLWLVTAAPVVVYLLLHPLELQSPRGQDLMFALGPAMAVNICFVLFYTRLQDTLDRLALERIYLKESSERDVLTGVFNRRAGEQLLQALESRPDEPFGIILCDIDHFKRINDTHGHAQGDQVLREVASRFQAHLRQGDVLIRWGGEEFVVVVTGKGVDSLKVLAERLRQVIGGEPIGTVGRVTASFGVAQHRPAESRQDLFDRADQALYQAKNLGRNQVVWAGVTP
ncbi:MAG: GGDEF domain-containing protein [Gloeomargaritaceae cyanobacterium C42_A2020_066]|nr:GGDEF domain-containing protein [Gloeomargaritaceae cyanobacterium C42_A2020_066]